MNTIKIITVCLVMSVTLHAQQHDSVSTRLNKYQLGFGLGYQSRQLLDEQKSALVYRSKEFQGFLFFKKERERSLFLTRLDFGTGSYEAKHKPHRQIYSVDYDIHGTATPDSFPVTSAIRDGKLKITYLRNLSNRNIRWMAGATVREHLIYPDNYVGLLNSISLDAVLYASKNINPHHTVSAKLEVPVVGINTRLPWHNTASDPVKPEITAFFEKGSRWVTVNRYQSVEFNFNYSWKISARWDIGADYEFNWIRVPYFQPMKSYANRISVFTIYNF